MQLFLKQQNAVHLAESEKRVASSERNEWKMRIFIETRVNCEN